jgi:hypothetical protein
VDKCNFLQQMIKKMTGVLSQVGDRPVGGNKESDWHVARGPPMGGKRSNKRWSWTLVGSAGCTARARPKLTVKLKLK